jgi:HlyD family secretion protein
MTKKKITYFVGFGFLGLGLVYLLYTGIKLIMPYNLSEGDFRTTVVDYGTVLTLAEAEGIVEPENEVLLLAPATSIIEKIVNEAGSRVKAGDLILKLDPKPVEESIDKLMDDLEIKRNNLAKNRLNAKNVTLELD